MDPQNFLQTMYKEQCDQARQHEMLRQQSTTILVTVSTAIITFTGVAATPIFTGLDHAGYKKFFAIYSIIGLFIVGLGWFGRQLSLKHYERSRFNRERARAYRAELEKLFEPAQYGRSLRVAADEIHLQTWKKDTPDHKGTMVSADLYTYWLNIYYFIMLFGILLLIGPIVAAFL
jgi:hypothetical protein